MNNKKIGDLTENYNAKDGLWAILFYLIYISLCFFQGFLFTTNLSINFLNSLQVAFPMLTLTLCIGLLLLLKNKPRSIGLKTEYLPLSLILGGLGAVLLIVIQLAYNYFQNDLNASFQFSVSNMLIIFAAGAISEEIIFRGYLGTRLFGLIKNPIITSCITAILFLLIHYPIRWIVSGNVSIWVLSGFYIVSLLLLHFACDLVYKKTNCLWGAILLHFLYNLIGAMVIYR